MTRSTKARSTDMDSERPAKVSTSLERPIEVARLLQLSSTCSANPVSRSAKPLASSLRPPLVGTLAA